MATHTSTRARRIADEVRDEAEASDRTFTDEVLGDVAEIVAEKAAQLSDEPLSPPVDNEAKIAARSEAIAEAHILHVRKEDIQRYGEQHATVLSKVRQAVAGTGLIVEDFSVKVNTKRRVLTIKLVGEEGFNWQLPLPYNAEQDEPKVGTEYSVDETGVVEPVERPDSLFNVEDLPEGESDF